jgi:DNA invertase Pin-like site-specific DNA recombinase
MQRAAISSAAGARGDEVAAWYEDRQSGGTLDRADLHRLRAAARAGEVKRLYVYRLDRLTRTGIRDTLSLLTELREYGCEVRSVADGFDLAGPFADVVVAVISWAAQMERIAIGERISSARTRLEKQGRSWGRPQVLLPSQIKQATALRADGQSWRDIAKKLGVSRTTLQRGCEVARKPPPKKGGLSVRKCRA